MHRSGTSVVARSMEVMGVQLGERLIPSAEGINDKGFWEDIDINALNIEMLEALNVDWHYLAPIIPKDFEMLVQIGFLQRAAELISSKAAIFPVYGFKDPRLAKLLPFWKMVFDHLEYEVGYILAVRNPMSVAASLFKRDGFEIEKCYLLWLDHVLTSLSGTNGCRRIIVDYDKLIQNTERELCRIADNLGLPIDPSRLDIYRTEFLDIKLRHSAYNMDDLEQDTNVPALVREIYGTMTELSSGLQIDNAVIQEKTVKWQAELFRINPALTLADKLYHQKENIVQTLLERNTLITNLEAQIATQTELNTTITEEMTRKSGELIQKHDALRQKEQELSTMSGELSLLISELFKIKSSFSYTLRKIMVSPALLFHPSKLFTRLMTSVDFMKNSKLIRHSSLFDSAFYLQNYPDVKHARINPAKHYCSHGWKEGRNPGPAFNTNYYITTYPDVKSAGINPLLHFIKYGKKEGRSALEFPKSKNSH